MKTRQTIQSLALLAACGVFAAHAGDLTIGLDVGAKTHRVTFTVTVENRADETVNLMPHLDGTNFVSSSLLWTVNGRPAEFMPKRAFLMYPPFDRKALPPHSTNAVALVEDDELVFVSVTTNAHTRIARAALPNTGQYKIEVITAGEWGGHAPLSATATVNIEKESPTSPCTVRAVAVRP